MKKIIRLLLILIKDYSQENRQDALAGQFLHIFSCSRDTHLLKCTD